MVKKETIKKWNKKGQIKMQQMLFMLLAITLLFVFAGLFVISFKMGDIKQQATILEENNAKLLVTKLANSPEFSCGRVFDSSYPACVDSDKLMALRESGNIRKYLGFWQVASIEVQTIYPNSGRNVNCTLANYPNCNIISVYKKPSSIPGVGYSNFVALCRKEAVEGEIINKCELAKLVIINEQRV